MDKMTSWQTTFLRELEDMLNCHMRGLGEVPEESRVRIDAFKFVKANTDHLRPFLDEEDDHVNIAFDDVLVRVSRHDESDVPVFHPNRFQGYMILKRRLVHPKGQAPRGIYRSTESRLTDKYLPLS